MRSYYEKALRLGMSYSEKLVGKVTWNRRLLGTTLDSIFRENVRWFREVWLKRLIPALTSYYATNKSEESFKELKRVLEFIRYQLAFYGQVVTPIFSLAVIEAVGSRLGLSRSLLDSMLLIEWVGPDDTKSCPVCRTMVEHSPYHYLELKSVDVFPGYNVRCCTNCRCMLVPIAREDVVSPLIGRFIDITTIPADYNFYNLFLSAIKHPAGPEFMHLVSSLPSTLRRIEYFLGITEIKFITDWSWNEGIRLVQDFGILALDKNAAPHEQVAQVARLLGVYLHTNLGDSLEWFDSILLAQREKEWENISKLIAKRDIQRLKKKFFKLEDVQNFEYVKNYLYSKGLLSELQLPLSALHNRAQYFTHMFYFMVTDYSFFRSLPFAQEYQNFITAWVWFPEEYSKYVSAQGIPSSWKPNTRTETIIKRITKNLGSFTNKEGFSAKDVASFLKDVLESHPILRRKEFWRGIDTVMITNEGPVEFVSSKMLRLQFPTKEEYEAFRHKWHREGRMPLGSKRHIQTFQSLPVLTHELGHALFEIHFLDPRKKLNLRYLLGILQALRAEALNGLGDNVPAQLKFRLLEVFNRADSYARRQQFVPIDVVEEGFDLIDKILKYTTWSSPFRFYSLVDVNEFFADVFSAIISHPSTLRYLSPNVSHHMEVLIKDIILKEEIVSPERYQEILKILEKLRAFRKVGGVE